ncbi:hypothetical protein [Heyndrickxia camelliae]|uniref:Uncharacterized protein n=1 Tax=Heyndrickxia camelliae TaxID=1707093 RepID=A0A2N3LEP4_9BACI|nr:hypothetical protein [Heyndrickxia camelliae]PKR83059.1 hypothetical protein CWO92_21215 [Heyndrickxia camelliae]
MKKRIILPSILAIVIGGGIGGGFAYQHYVEADTQKSHEFKVADKIEDAKETVQKDAAKNEVEEPKQNAKAKSTNIVTNKTSETKSTESKTNEQRTNKADITTSKTQQGNPVKKVTNYSSSQNSNSTTNQNDNKNNNKNVSTSNNVKNAKPKANLNYSKSTNKKITSNNTKRSVEPSSKSSNTSENTSKKPKQETSSDKGNMDAVNKIVDQINKGNIKKTGEGSIDEGGNTWIEFEVGGK